MNFVNRLFATADKTGIYADSTIYGQGLVDLDAATSPVGELRVIFDDQASVAMADTQVNLGPAFGDSLSQGLAGQEIAAFDNLNAPFFLSLSNLYRARTLSTSCRVIPARLYRCLMRQCNSSTTDSAGTAIIFLLPETSLPQTYPTTVFHCGPTHH